MTARYAVVGAVLAALAYLGLELFLFDEAVIFHGDHERDLRHVTLLVQHGIWPTSSPSISPLPFELGPLSYLLLAPGVVMSPDPFVVRVWVLLLAALAAGLLFRLLATRARPAAAALAVFGLLSSTFVYELSRQLWHSSLLLLPTVAWLWAIARLLEDDRPLLPGIAAAALSAVCLQLHMTASAFVLVTIGAALWRRHALGSKGLGLGTLAFLVAWLPMGLGILSALSDGALDPLGGRGRGWSPVNPLPFFVDNVHTIWGDDLGPLLTWPWILAIITGAATARRPFPRALVAIVLVGLAVEAALLGNQPRAHRYMHANLVASFALAAYGLDALFRRFSPPRAASVAALLALLVTVVTVEAAISEVPHAADTGWLSAREQRAVAEVVATKFPLSEKAAEVRIHGIFFGERMGMGHLWLLAMDENRGIVRDLSNNAHVIVMPSDLAAHAGGTPEGEAFTVKGPLRDVAVYARRPQIVYDLLEMPQALRQRWRRPGGFEGSKAWLKVPIREPAVVFLAWMETRGGRDPCDAVITVDGVTLQAETVDTSRYEPLRIMRVPVPRAGILNARLNGCRGVTLLDVW